MAEISFFPIFEDEVEDLFCFDTVPLRSHIHSSDSESIGLGGHHLSTVSDGEIFDFDSSGLNHRPNNTSSVGDSSDVSGRENQVKFVVDLFHQQLEQSQVNRSVVLISEPEIESSFGVIEQNDEMGITSLDLELGLGLGVGVESDEKNNRLDGGDNRSGLVVSDFGNEFFVSRRNRRCEDYGCSSTLKHEDQFPDGLKIVGVESDSDVEGNDRLRMLLQSEDGDDDYCSDDVHDDDDDDDDDASARFCWDSLHLEDHRDGNDDFEWEEVDGRVDEREVLGGVVVPDEEGSISISHMAGPEDEGSGERERERESELGNLEWEVLLNVNNLDRTENDSEQYFGDYEDYVYTAEYEMMLGHFAEDDNICMGRPPASKSVVQSLTSVVMTQEDVNINVVCAVCKDGIDVGQQAKQLPCSHRYHGGCIIPWLGIRNTCPVCRHELLTDDAEYERRKTQRANRLS